MVSNAPMSPVRLPDFDRGPALSMSLSGRPLRAYLGETVGVALWGEGEAVVSRSIKYHRPRGIFCLEGHCGSCLMRIGGKPNVPACLEPCEGDLEIEGQNALPTPDLDLLGAVDWLFPGGMNHHTLMTGSKLLNQVANKVVRKLSGLGELPKQSEPRLPPVRAIRVDVCVVGGGRAGLSAAQSAARAGAKTLLLEGFRHLGGSLLSDPRAGLPVAQRHGEELAAAGVQVQTRCRVLGYYPEDAGGVLVGATAEGLLRVFANAFIYATGGYAQNLPFADNDRPGVLAARAVGRMLCLHGMLAGERLLFAGNDPYAVALAAALEARGAHVTVVPARALRRALGGQRVTGAEIVDEHGQAARVACDVIAVSTAPAPASELIRQHGGAVELRPERGGFCAIVDGDGRTDIANVFAVGRVTGADPNQGIVQAERAGRAAARGPA